MIAINHRRISITGFLAGLFLLITSPATQAAFVFTGQSLDVTYQETGFELTNSIIAGDNDPDISYLDSSNIGNGIMLDYEFIDFTDTSVTFSLRGDYGDVYSPGYQTTGLDGSYIITLTSADFSIGSVSIGSMTDMIGVSLGTEVTFNGKNIFFDISTLGILEVTPGADIGSITLNVEFVPIPAALPLMLSGLMGLVLVSRRRIFK